MFCPGPHKSSRRPQSKNSPDYPTFNQIEYLQNIRQPVLQSVIQKILTEWGAPSSSTFRNLGNMTEDETRTR